MKKSIFLFFAAILCAMSANAATYLAGSMNGWSSNNSSYEFKGSPLTLSVELPGKTYYEFKIVVDGSWKGNSGTIDNSISNWTFNSGDNCKLNTNLPGTYKFVWSSGKLSVTYPEAPAPHDITVRAKVPASWTNVKAWVWTSENGEGTEITPEKEGDYYVVTKNAGALFVIYKNGTGWSNGDKNQTVDLVYTEDVCLQLNQSGNAKATATVIDCGAVAKDITVKAVVPEAWGDNVWAHVWETGASGTDVKLTEKEGNWYVYTKNCLELNIIFKSGEGWSNIEQTADITGVKENACYSISSINKTDGKCNVTVVDCDAVIEPEVKPEDIYTVVGSSAELGLEWNPAKEANDMEKQGDGSYKKVYSNVELTSDVEWKIAKNDGWWDGPTFNQSNNTLTIAQSGIYNVTFTLSADLATATATAELLEATNTVADCFISGNAALTGGAGWAGNEFEMEYDPATETYSYTLTGLAAETAYELQVVLGGNWYGYEKLQTIPTGVENKEGHIAFTLAEAGDVTVTYHATNGINLTGNFAEPVTYDYYLTGTLVGGWSAKQQGIEKDGELYKATFNNLAAGTYEFKITDGQFNTEEDKTHEHTTLGAAYKEVSYNEGNIKIVTEEAKNITVIFDATAGKITFDGLTPVVVTYQLKGVGGWDQPGIELVQNPDPEKPSEYMLTCQAISATDAIKVVRLEDGVIKGYYGNGTVKDGVEVTVNYDADGNITLPEGKYNFYFDTNEPEKKLWIAEATGCETEPEYNVVKDTITNFVFDLEAWPMVCTGGPSKNYEIEVYLTLDGEGILVYEDCSVEIMGTDATFIDGTLSNIDPYAPSADAVLHVLWGEEEYYELQLSMSAVAPAPVDVVAANATVTFNDNEGALKFNGTDIYGGDAVYVEVAGFEYNDADEYTLNGLQISMFENKNTEAFAFADEVTVAIDEDGYVTVEGVYTSYNDGGIYNVRIGGELPKYTLTLSSDVSDATLTGSGTYYATQEVTVTATQELPGWVFDHWSDGDEKVSTDATYTFRLGKDLELTANYLEIYTRTVAENQWGTICLPNASSSFTGATFYEVSSLDPEKGLWLDQLAAGTQLEAGKPYIFQATATEITVTYTDAAPEDDPVPGAKGLTGTFTDIAAAEDGVLVGNYIIGGNKVHVATAQNDLPANRAYINAALVPNKVQAVIPGRRRVCMGENATTGLDQIVAPEGQAMKVIENGQLIIIRDGVKYNVQGQVIR